jgi:4-hydroxy-2-oxoheptanedioate aldolase
VLIGPHDLSLSLGIPEEYEHPRFEEAVQNIIQCARAKNVGVGIHCNECIDLEIGWLKSGLNMLIHSSDIAIFAQHIRQDLNEIRSAVVPVNNHRPHLPMTAQVTI